MAEVRASGWNIKSGVFRGQSQLTFNACRTRRAFDVFYMELAGCIQGSMFYLSLTEFYEIMIRAVIDDMRTVCQLLG